MTNEETPRFPHFHRTRLLLLSSLCAHGQVTQAITLDKHGDFDVAGTFTREHGGPVRRDENTPPAPARYSGHVDDDTLSLTVTLAKEKVGTFTLTRGSRPNLRKCR